MLTKPRDKKVVVFLCTGDTCRGPMAQGYMKRKLEEKGIGYMEVRTAGVMTVAGLVPTPEAKQVMDKEGIDISKHRSAPLTKELLRRSDIILGMTPFHVQFAKRLDEDTKDKAVLLKEFAKSDMKNYQVTDPMGATLEVYKRVYREIKLAVDRLMEHEFVLNPPSDEIDIPAPRPRPASPPPVPAPAAKAENGAAKPKVAEKPVAPAKKGSPAGKGAPAKKPGKPALKSVVRKPLAAVAKKDGGKKK